MKQSNPYLEYPERAPYELGTLLRTLPIDLDADGCKTEDEALRLAAADRHALNHQSTLLHGLEAMGRLMSNAGVCEYRPVSQLDVSQLGELVSHLALQLQFIEDFRSNIADTLLKIEQKGGRV
jgi:hypothetical protein